MSVARTQELLRRSGRGWFGPRAAKPERLAAIRTLAQTEFEGERSAIASALISIGRRETDHDVRRTILETLCALAPHRSVHAVEMAEYLAESLAGTRGGSGGLWLSRLAVWRGIAALGPRARASGVLLEISAKQAAQDAVDRGETPAVFAWALVAQARVLTSALLADLVHSLDPRFGDQVIEPRFGERLLEELGKLQRAAIGLHRTEVLRAINWLLHGLWEVGHFAPRGAAFEAWHFPAWWAGPDPLEALDDNVFHSDYDVLRELDVARGTLDRLRQEIQRSAM